VAKSRSRASLNVELSTAKRTQSVGLASSGIYSVRISRHDVQRSRGLAFASAVYIKVDIKKHALNKRQCTPSSSREDNANPTVQNIQCHNSWATKSGSAKKSNTHSLVHYRQIPIVDCIFFCRCDAIEYQPPSFHNISVATSSPPLHHRFIIFKHLNHLVLCHFIFNYLDLIKNSWSVPHSLVLQHQKLPIRKTARHLLAQKSCRNHTICKP
jgi:hypothetical protein